MQENLESLELISDFKTANKINQLSKEELDILYMLAVHANGAIAGISIALKD